MKKIPSGMHIVLHSACTRPAFLYGTKPIKGTRIKRELTFHLDGSKFEPGSLSRCGSCGGLLRGASDLQSGGPVLRTFDMSNPQDMREFHKHINNAEAIA